MKILTSALNWKKSKKYPNEIHFLEVLPKKFSDKKLETGVYWKHKNTGIYINWNVHAPTESKNRDS